MDAKTRDLALLALLSLFCAISAWAGDRDVFGSVFFALGVVGNCQRGLITRVPLSFSFRARRMVRGAGSRYSTAPIDPRGVGKMPRLVRSDDPIPVGHIRLSQAFDLYYEAVTHNWQGLDAAINEPMASPPAAGKDGEATNTLVLAFNARDAARGAAEMKFR